MIDLLNIATFFLPPVVFAALAYYWMQGWWRTGRLALWIYRQRNPDAGPVSVGDMVTGFAVLLVMWPFYAQGGKEAVEKLAAQERDREWRRAHRRKLR